MAVPIDVASGPGGPAPEEALSASDKAIEGRSLGQIAWRRLRKDKVAMAGGVVIVILIAIAVFGPYFVANPISSEYRAPTTIRASMSRPVIGSTPNGWFRLIPPNGPIGRL